MAGGRGAKRLLEFTIQGNMEPSPAIQKARDLFKSTFSANAPISAFAPGRINLIGEHTDYNEGFVFPMAIQNGIAVAARPTSGPSRLISAQFGDSSFDVSSATPGTIDDWGKYPAGVGWAITDSGLGDPPNLEAAVFGDLPIGAGVSGSAALCVAFAHVWNHLLGLGLATTDIARIAQKAENDFVGMRCGIMDQLASASGQRGCAMYIDTRSLEIRYAAAPPEHKVVLCNTMVKHELVQSEYNTRRNECEAAAKYLGVESLRDARLDDLLEKQDGMDPLWFRRARHVVTENTRCQSFFWALEDRNELRMELLLRASHESLREDFEVTIPELDLMAEACWMAPGCVGARMTGGGFGGSCVAIVREADVESFARSTANRYESKTGIKPNFLVCDASDGASAELTK